ncbi:unnamed protein product [Fraxinus pennsylvanica]|uniref:Uncharacterized protein n=1 Tax=Fraxinus pennsylvanica TaxID=56036 RepID=A0AAD2DW61_9LAMI|nr:unnamed protein product [Fraxinus pennsylvanica]
MGVFVLVSLSALENWKCQWVVSIKASGIAIKLTLEGINQIGYPQTWFFFSVAIICVIAQCPPGIVANALSLGCAVDYKFDRCAKVFILIRGDWEEGEAG